MAVYTTINKPEDYFKAVLYTGTHSSVPTVTVGWKSDFLWLKSRTQTYDHNLLDTTRGGSNKLASNNSNAASTSGDSVTFNATTFQPSGQAINESGQGTNNMISWNWKANGGTTVTNNAGSLSSTVQANTTAGFSVVKWTSDGNNGRTVGHGLGVKPTVIITKNISAAGSWYSFFEAAGVDKYLRLNSTDAVTTNTDIFGGGAQATAVFTIGQSTAGYSNGNDIIAYVFAPIQGYSKFGSYTGNGSADGAFVYTGFKPAWVMYKQTNAGTRDWAIVDDKRDTFNVCDEELYANTSDATGDVDLLDFVSNGFKCRRSHNSQNGDGDTYIYMAFASNPFVTSDGVPTTAR